MEGISALHGGHHEAQKFMKTTLPRSIDELRIFPSCEEKEKSVPACCLMGASFFMAVFNTPVEMIC
jgi:hypothetical protein